MAIPVARIFKFASKGYSLARTIGGKFHVFERVVPASNLSGQAKSVYVKIFNQQGKLIKKYKDAYKIDGRHYERAFYKPNNIPRTRKLH